MFTDALRRIERDHWSEYVKKYTFIREIKVSASSGSNLNMYVLCVSNILEHEVTLLSVKIHKKDSLQIYFLSTNFWDWNANWTSLNIFPFFLLDVRHYFPWTLHYLFDGLIFHLFWLALQWYVLQIIKHIWKWMGRHTEPYKTWLPVCLNLFLYILFMLCIPIQK